MRIFLPTSRNTLVMNVILVHNPVIKKSTNRGALFANLPKLITSADFIR